MFQWTSERMETLRRMWEDGSSSSEISRELGEVTRNAVMGKVNRMGLMRSATHNANMSRAPEGACRTSMERARTRGDVLADAPADLVDAADAAATMVDAKMPEGSADRSVDVGVPGGTVDARHVEASAPQPAATVAHEEPAPARVAKPDPVVEAEASEAPEASSTVQPSKASATTEPAKARTGADLARAYLRAKPIRSKAERASRPWRESRTSPSRREPTPFAAPPKGLLSRVRAASSGGDVDHRVAVSFVREMGGGVYDPERIAHQAALVAVATVLARGDPRRILVPFMSEPTVLRMMRTFAEKAIVVAGKAPERWADEESGDAAFFDDVVAVEGPRKVDAGLRAAA